MEGRQFKHGELVNVDHRFCNSDSTLGYIYEEYQDFENVIKLSNDFRKGVFDLIFGG